MSQVPKGPMDGILSQEHWEEAEVKVLHLLKQPSEVIKDSDGIEMTFQEQVEDQVHEKREELHHWWEEIALRSAAVLYPNVGWKKATGDVGLLRRALQSSAIVNICKDYAKETDDKDVREWAKKYSGLDNEGCWERQIEDCKPTGGKFYVILCGGLTTFWAAYDSLRGKKLKRSKKNYFLATGMRYFDLEGATWLALPHPSARNMMRGMIHTWLAASWRVVLGEGDREKEEREAREHAEYMK